MKHGLPLTLMAIGILSGCTSQPKITTISNMNEVERYIVNVTHTMDWTYCGKTEHSYIILKRNDGEFRSSEDSLYHKFPMKWIKPSWFLVKPDGVSMPNEINAGEKLILNPEGFVKSPNQLSFTILTNTPNQHMDFTGKTLAD